MGGQMYMPQAEMGHMGMPSAFTHVYPPMMNVAQQNLNPQFERSMNAMTNYCM